MKNILPRASFTGFIPKSNIYLFVVFSIYFWYNAWMKKIWFRRKRYGYGWYPSTWEGWVVIAVWVCFFVSFVANMDHEWLKNDILIFLSIIVLIGICYWKGEKPKWQWGELGMGPERKTGANEGE